MYIKLKNFAVHLKLTQHCKSNMLQKKKKKGNDNDRKKLNIRFNNNIHDLSIQLYLKYFLKI